MVLGIVDDYELPGDEQLKQETDQNFNEVGGDSDDLPGDAKVEIQRTNREFCGAGNDQKNFEKNTEVIRESKDGEPVGIFAKDRGFSGPFLDAWRKVLGKFSNDDKSTAMG